MLVKKHCKTPVLKENPTFNILNAVFNILLNINLTILNTVV